METVWRTAERGRQLMPLLRGPRLPRTVRGSVVPDGRLRLSLERIEGSRDSSIRMRAPCHFGVNAGSRRRVGTLSAT